MDECRKRYIVTREPIGTANKHFQDLSSQLKSMESVLLMIQTVVQSLADKSSTLDRQICGLAECSNKTSNGITDIDKKLQSLTFKIDRRERRLRRRIKVDDTQNRTEKNVKTEYNISVKPVESLQDLPKTTNFSKSMKEIEKHSNTKDINASEIDESIEEEASELESGCLDAKEDDSPAVIVNTRSKNENSNDITDSSLLIPLNKEDDYPDGSWLGDPQDSNRRVRVGFSSSDLDSLMQTNNTPEKLALALLDKLFTRDILAISNLTGKGKHNKKRLDPLLIYAIYSQLRHVYNISDSDWSRIKNNMEAKCRFLWRQKMKPKMAASRSNQQQQHSLEQQLGKDQQQSLVGWSNEVLIAGRGPEDTGNIVLYPLYQVDNQLIHVPGVQNVSSSHERSEEVSLSQTAAVEMVEARSKLETMTDANEHVVELVRNPSKPTSEQENSDMNHQTLTLSGGDLIMTDLGEVISITSEADVDFHYL